jgi:hypothetical protein
MSEHISRTTINQVWLICRHTFTNAPVPPPTRIPPLQKKKPQHEPPGPANFPHGRVRGEVAGDPAFQRCAQVTCGLGKRWDIMPLLNRRCAASTYSVPNACMKYALGTPYSTRPVLF